MLEAGALYDIHNIALVHHVNQALRAHKLFTRDVDYIVKDDKVVIIDEFTGRMMEGRRYSEGLHQALEAKEGVTIQNENQTLASITFQNYFRLFPKLAGMTGTAMTEAPELLDIYKLESSRFRPTCPASAPTPTTRSIAAAREKYEADDQAGPGMPSAQAAGPGRHRQHRKIGGAVGAVQESEDPAPGAERALSRAGSLIIAQAGRPGAVTIATNMAGRGTDIQLGGNLDMRLKQELAENRRPGAARAARRGDPRRNRGGARGGGEGRRALCHRQRAA